MLCIIYLFVLFDVWSHLTLQTVKQTHIWDYTHYNPELHTGRRICAFSLSTQLSQHCFLWTQMLITHTHTHWECLVAFIPQLALNKLCAERWHTHSEVIMSEETVFLPKLFPQSEWTSVHKYSFLQAGYKSLVIYSNQKLYVVIQGTTRLYEIISPCNKPHWHGTIFFWSGFIWLLRNTFKKQLWLECTKWPWPSWLFMTRSLSKNIRWSFNDMKSLVEVFIFQME